jgi:hypothetical protein
MLPALSQFECVDLVTEAVDNARQSMLQHLGGSEKAGDTVKLMLTVDLSRKNIDSIPDDAVQILKRDVER